MASLDTSSPSLVSRIPKFLSLALVACVVWSLMSPPAIASQLTARSITMSNAIPSAIANHNFSFTYTSTSAIGSVAFEYCDNSPVFAYVCNPPAGLDVTAANLASQSGNTGFSINGVATTANKLVITRPPLAAAAVASTYNFTNITNPSTPNSAVFVRITTYATVDATGPYTDYGAVATAIISPFNIGASVPPFLRLCVGISVAVDCSVTANSTVDLGILRPSSARANQSQFAAGTNSITGYVVYILGTTMTSGNNSITALSSPTPSFPGNSQFGINLRANSNPSVGQNPSGSGTAIPAANYNTPNLFMLQSGDAIATDTIPSDFNRMTVSYMANIPSSQAPGIYSTTFTYLATAQF